MKLTIKIREEMRDAIIKKKFDPKIAKVKKTLQTIAQQTSDAFYPKKIKDWMSAIPTGVSAFHNKSSICLADGKDTFRHHVLTKNKWRYYISLRKSFKVLASDQYTEELQVSAKNAERLIPIKKELDAIEKERDDTREVIVSALWSCNTRKQLEDNYPDLVPYLPKIEKQTKALTVTNDAVKKVLA